MNVRLAAQTLSNSVKKALIFLEKLRDVSFEGTPTFCEMFSNAFDILNCRHIYDNSKAKQPFRIPLTDSNVHKLQVKADEIKDYMQNLEIYNKRSGLVTPVFESERSCGFTGFYTCLTNIFSLYEHLKKSTGLIVS